jgi:hypothetical protein
MPTVSLKAHYDGQRVVLDEPVKIPVGAALMVTVLPEPVDKVTSDRAQWTDLAANTLARAYGDDEPEYTLADVKNT